MSFRLVYDHKIFIFIKNIQRNILWKNVRFFEIRNFKEDVITLLRLIICFYRLSVYGNRLVLEKFLKIGTGKIRQCSDRYLSIRRDCSPASTMKSFISIIIIP